MNKSKSDKCSNKIPLRKAEECYLESCNPYTKQILTAYIAKNRFAKTDIEKLTDAIVEFCLSRFSIAAGAAEV